MPDPTPISPRLKLLRGNPGRRRIKGQPQPQISSEPPAPPEFLSAEAKAEWQKLAPELHRCRLLTPLDTSAFAVYCQVFAHWLAAERELARAAAADPETGGLLAKGSHGQPMVNPLLRAARNAASDMLTCAQEFGLTPLSRGRIALGTYDGPAAGPSKFGDLIPRDPA